jgi:hypothetical protein
MSNRSESPTVETRTIHPHAIAELGGVKYAIAALEVARRLRDGTIPAKLYRQQNFSWLCGCGTAHCIAGWIAELTEHTFIDRARAMLLSSENALFTHLFCAVPLSGRKPTPHQAADAIYRYIYDFSDRPWSVA